jgi:hypothetical protein
MVFRRYPFRLQVKALGQPSKHGTFKLIEKVIFALNVKI